MTLHDTLSALGRWSPTGDLMQVDDAGRWLARPEVLSAARGAEERLIAERDEALFRLAALQDRPARIEDDRATEREELRARLERAERERGEAVGLLKEARPLMFKEAVPSSEWDHIRDLSDRIDALLSHLPAGGEYRPKVGDRLWFKHGGGLAVVTEVCEDGRCNLCWVPEKIRVGPNRVENYDYDGPATPTELAAAGLPVPGGERPAWVRLRAMVGSHGIGKVVKVETWTAQSEPIILGAGGVVSFVLRYGEWEPAPVDERLEPAPERANAKGGDAPSSSTEPRATVPTAPVGINKAAPCDSTRGGPSLPALESAFVRALARRELGISTAVTVKDHAHALLSAQKEV